MWPTSISRIVFVAPRIPEMSGGSVAIENLSEALESAGIDVVHISLLPGNRPPRFDTHVVTPDEDLHAGPVLRGQGHPLRRLPRLVRKRWQRLANGLRIRRLLRQFGPETAIVFTHVKGRIVLDSHGWTGPQPGGPIVIGQHHSQFISLEAEPWLREAIPRWFADVDAFVALSEGDAQDFGSILPVDCYAIPNPAAPLPAPAAPWPRPPVAVALARYSPEKQLDVMITAFANVTLDPQLSNWRLRLYGDGPLRGALQELIDELGAGDGVTLMGPVTDVSEPLAAASLNLLSSAYEGFPMSILEAAQAGVPSLSFACSAGVRELVPEGAGILVAPGDTAAYRDALGWALASDAPLSAMGESARKHSGSYSPEAVLARWAELLADCEASRLDRRREAP